LLRGITRGALIAALYAALTLLFAPLSYSYLQVRISEALTVLPILTPTAIPALFVGTLLANLLSPVGWPDVVFGSLLTLIAATVTYHLRKHAFFALLSPVLVNAFGVSAYLFSFYRIPYWLSVATVGLGEAIAVFLLGYPLLRILQSRKRELNI
jgi:uncharacterized membrane protein